MSVLGGAVLIWLGIGMFKARARVIEAGKGLPYNSVVAGEVTSALNPFFILWWATIGSMLVMELTGVRYHRLCPAYSCSLAM